MKDLIQIMNYLNIILCTTDEIQVVGSVRIYWINLKNMKIV